MSSTVGLCSHVVSIKINIFASVQHSSAHSGAVCEILPAKYLRAICFFANFKYLCSILALIINKRLINQSFIIIIIILNYTCMYIIIA